MPNPSNSDLVGEAVPDDLTHYMQRCSELAQQLEQAERDLERAKDVLYHALPALGLHPRGFSQQALIEACELVGSDPEDWTRHPNVMRERRAALTPDEGADPGGR